MVKKLNIRNFQKWAWFTVVYLILVIAWGAVVRLSGSGAGCGAHWPTCNGEIIPLAPQMETIIEFGHRLTSGMSLLLVGGIWWMSRKLYLKGHLARKFAGISLFFLLIEAGLGASLVLLELVALNSSALRALMSAIHLGNTFILLAFASLTAFSAPFDSSRQLQLNFGDLRQKQLFFLLGLLLFVGMSGAIAALGDTLFPATGLIQGIRDDFSPTSHFLIRLRFIHPVLAVFTAVFILYFSRNIKKSFSNSSFANFWHQVDLIVIAQLAVGTINVVLQAPAWVQIFHLVLADLLWVRIITAGSLFFIGKESATISENKDFSKKEWTPNGVLNNLN